MTFNKVFAIVFGLTGLGALWAIVKLGAWWQGFILAICVVMVVVLIYDDKKNRK